MSFGVKCGVFYEKAEGCHSLVLGVAQGCRLGGTRADGSGVEAEQPTSAWYLEPAVSSGASA